MRRVLIGVAIGACAAATALLWSRTDAGRRAEASTYDWRLAAHTTPARDDIVIVDINESSMRALAPRFGRWPWPRIVHAGAIDYFARAGARAVIYDVQFTERDTLGNYRIAGHAITGPESDAELAGSVRRAGTVVMLADALFQGLVQPSAEEVDCGKPVPSGTPYDPGPGLLSRPSICSPFPALQEGAAALGHDFLQKDPGGVSRRMFPFVESHGVAVPSLGLEAVLLTQQIPAEGVRLSGQTLQVGDATLPLDDDGELLLKFHGPYLAADGKSTFPVYSFFDVLVSEDSASSGVAPLIPESAFADKIVFVGGSAAAMTDVHATPFGDTTPGIYLHATLADNVLSRDFMRHTGRAADIMLIAGAGLLAGLIAITLPVWWGTGAIITLAAGWTALAMRLVGAGIWAPVVAPLMAVGLSYVGGLTWQYFVEGREKRQVKRLFGRYVSPDVFDHLMANPDVARLGGERREMTVLFSDIRGFTSASEEGTPEAVVAQLNEYFGAMVEVVFRHRGTVDKFVGDMVMALFGAPVADAEHAEHAVAAALDMSAALDDLNTRWAAAGRPVLDIGIGLNSGTMIAGNIGSQSIMSYTVIGDAVNLGSRIESLNKDYGTRILISQATKDRLSRPVQTRRVSEVTVKGRREPVVVWEVVAPRRAGDT